MYYADPLRSAGCLVSHQLPGGASPLLFAKRFGRGNSQFHFIKLSSALTICEHAMAKR
jgi:hypothetical protein